MANTMPGTMEGVEQRRLLLETNISKLQDSLKRWQTWEFEYEMLKEEIQSAGAPTADQMLEIGRTLGGTHINEKEVTELLGHDRQTKRDANQVIDLISKRVNYVQQNISTVQKQLDSAEKKLAGTSMLLQPDLENEEGLPLMDIQEELDDAGNVVSSSVMQPGKAAPEIVEALRKTGVNKSNGQEGSRDKTSQTPPSQAAQAKPFVENPTIPDAQASASLPTLPDPQTVPTPNTSLKKKSVSFADGSVKEEPAIQPSGRQALKTTGYNEALADYNFTKGTKVIEVDSDEEEIASYPIIPEDDTPEAAALRRQMLQYGLSEVGQVVAEIDLDDPGQEYSDEDMDADEDFDEDEESEEEDEYGRTIRPVVTDDYRKEMMELEKRLNARMLENVGPRPDTHPLAEHADDVRKLVVKKDEAFSNIMQTLEPRQDGLEAEQKSVRFADDRDASSAGQRGVGAEPASLSRAVSTPTVTETIVERETAASERPKSAPSKSAKTSRFKSSRASQAQPTLNPLPTPFVPEPAPVPQGPVGRTLAETVVEHDIASSPSQEPDEFDPVTINREIQTQYHKMRNRFIQERGGFKAPQEGQEELVVEEEDGKLKKMSRFKMAKLKADGM